jgi:hypothetical protein
MLPKLVKPEFQRAAQKGSTEQHEPASRKASQKAPVEQSTPLQKIGNSVEKTFRDIKNIFR